MPLTTCAYGTSISAIAPLICHGLSKRRVLLLEVSPVAAFDLQKVLEEEGFEVLGPAYTTVMALRLLEKWCEAIHLAVLDSFLIIESACPLVEHLQAKHIPIVILTSCATVEPRLVSDYLM